MSALVFHVRGLAHPIVGRWLKGGPAPTLKLSDQQAVTVTAVSTNTIDMGALSGIGTGRTMHVSFSTDATVTAAGAASVQFQLVCSASADLSAPVVLAQSDAIGKADPHRRACRWAGWPARRRRS